MFESLLVYSQTEHIQWFPAVFYVAALADVSEVVDQLQGNLIKMENFQKLLELKKDLIGIDNLIVPGRVSLKLESVNNLTHLQTSM